MASQTQKKALRRTRRKYHIRKKAFGIADRPRLSIFRSLEHIYAQVINDENGTTLASAATVEKAIAGSLKATGNKAAAEAVGVALAERAIKAGIKKVVFDRNGFVYHGRVQALAEAARKAGLEF